MREGGDARWAGWVEEDVNMIDGGGNVVIAYRFFERRPPPSMWVERGGGLSWRVDV